MRCELTLKDVVFETPINKTLMIKFLFSVPRHLRGRDFSILNCMALEEIKKRIAFPFVELNMVAWGDSCCKTFEKTIVLSFRDGVEPDFCIIDGLHEIKE